MKTANVLVIAAFALNAVACSGTSREAREDRAGEKSISPAAPIVPVAEAPKPVINLDEPVKPKAKPIVKEVAKRLEPIAIKRLIVSRGIENREPVEQADVFSIQDGTHLYAFVEVDNPSKEATEISVTFEAPDGTTRGSNTLHVGASPRWRTWAQTRFADNPGSWTVSVRDAQGTLICQAMFEMSAS